MYTIRSYIVINEKQSWLVSWRGFITLQAGCVIKHLISALYHLIFINYLKSRPIFKFRLVTLLVLSSKASLNGSLSYSKLYI